MSLLDAYIYWMPTILWWLFVIEFLGILVFPLINRIAHNLKDGGFFMCKAYALAALTFVTWLLSYAIGYGFATIIMAVLIVGGASFYFVRRHGISKIQLKEIAHVELVFLAVFFVFLTIQMHHPFIEGYGVKTAFSGERFSDSLFVSALSRSTQLPPDDPWLSGVKLYHYYYIGHLTGSILNMLTGVPVNILLNLAVPTLAGLAAAMSYGVVYNLTERRRYGILAIFLIVFAGNYFIFFQFAEDGFDIGKISAKISDRWDYYYWSSSRALFNSHQAITEFPFFTFMWGDFHPHTRGITFQLLVISVLLAIAKSGINMKNINGFVMRCVLLAIPLGFLLANNSWDFPFYAMLSFLVICTQAKGQVTKKLIFAVLPAILALVFYSPFILSVDTRAVDGIALTQYSSPLLPFLYIYTLPLFAGFSSALVLWKKKYSQAILLFIPAVAVLLLPLSKSFMLTAPLMLLCVWIYLKRKIDKNTLFVLALLFTALSVVAFSEAFYVRDYLQGGEFQRMNTTFKFYLQAWILFGIASAYGIWYIVKKVKDNIQKRIWAIALSMLLVMSAVYAPLAVNSWTKGFSLETTLDGLKYMESTEFQLFGKSMGLKGELAAITWINENIHGSPVMLEAVPLEAPYNQAFDHTYFSRISSLTGLPTVVGWVFSLFSWGYETDITVPRINDVNEIYNTTDTARAVQLLEKYNVAYVYVGAIENIQYPPNGLQKFDSIAEKVYDKSGIKIYKI